jgi:hypothetical protein
MNRACLALVLVLMIPISARAQNEAETSPSGYCLDYYLPLEIELEEELDFDLPSLECFWMDMDLLCDILLQVCLDLEMTDEDMYEMLPELWEPDYETHLFWEDDWY